MKSIKFAALGALSMFVAVGISSCNSSDDDSVQLQAVDFSMITDFNPENYWTKCYDVATGAVVVDGFSFSHEASAFTYEGITYTSWDGFCPSRVNDTSEHADNWTAYQWASIASNPYNGVFFVGNSGAEVSEDPLDNTTCTVQRADNGYFTPQFVYINNSSYAYYCAKNGSAFNPAFTSSDDLTLNIVGVRNGVMTAHLKAPLITQGLYLDYWLGVSLQNLGTVDKVLFYVDSNVKNEYGLQVPSYFCLTSFAYTLPEANAAK